MKNKTFVGLLCIVGALVFSFISANIRSTGNNKTIKAFITTQDIQAGEKIKEEMISQIDLSGDIPGNIIMNKDEIIDKYTKINLTKNDIFTNEKISLEAIYGSAYLENLDENKRAISISLNTLAIGLSGKLESGDIVSIIVVDEEEESSSIPEELKYVEVISISDSSGYDVKRAEDNSSNKSIGATATLLVNEEQSKILAKLENIGNIHLSLVYRGNDEYKQELLSEQNNVFGISEIKAE